MLKVLLVDDEPFILQGLAVLIDWNEAGFEITGKASNGLEAVEFLKKEKTDLVIADIKMPEMTGIELLEKVRKEKISEAYFVILSGYSDFEYARKALQNDCMDYMLKPVSKEELIRVLDKVRETYEISSQKREDDFLMEREAFAGNMIQICHGRYRADNVEYVKKYLGRGKSFRYVSAELDGSSREIKRLTEKEKGQLQKELYQKCILLFPGREYLCMIDTSIQKELYNVGIIYASESAEESEKEAEQAYLEEIQRTLKKSLEFPVVIIVGSSVDTIEKISDSCRSVWIARSIKGLDPKERLSWNLSERLLDRQLVDSLIRAVKFNDKGDIRGSCEALSREMGEKELDADMVNMVVNHLMFELLHLAQEQDENIDQETFRLINDAAGQINSINSEDMVHILSEYGDYLMQLRSHQSGEILRQIEEDIKENFKDNLTLKDMGKKYFINSAYLGQTFKKQYGESFKDYLNRIRIDEAAELLMYSDKKIYEIAEEVGYKDMDYFINKFIALKGCSPTKFRRKIK